MSNIPALCKKCNILFPSFIQAGPNVRIRVSNINQGCPNCGQPAEILSGAYETIGGILKLVKSNSISGVTLENIKKILEHSSVFNRDPNDVLNEINKEAPELEPIIQYLTQNKSDIFAILSLILMAIQVFLQLSPIKNNSDSIKQEFIINQTEIIINQTIEYHNNIVIKNRYQMKLINELKANPSATLKKIPLYETCPFCDSGTKYKFCCKKSLESKYK